MPIDLAKSEPLFKSAYRSNLSPLASDNPGASTHDRTALLARHSALAKSLVDRLLVIARHGLPKMYDGELFAHTLRAIRKQGGWTEQLEGISLRYTAMTALGLAQIDEASQARILEGSSIAELLQRAATRAEQSSDLGSTALVAWALAEVTGTFSPSLFLILRERMASSEPISTVECAWTLSAALAGRRLADTSDIIGMARTRLLSAKQGSPIFGHMIPASAIGRLRSHVGCFADQVYPIQALSRLHAATGDSEALAAAEACAERICALQGKDGQWWWHYDARNGRVVEGYPVYSVHQHAMAPMALLELREAGGSDFSKHIISGLRWLEAHPEVREALIVPEKGVVWRKVARREPNKLVRKLAAGGTALMPGFQLPALDALFPPALIDHECRPYEFGLLLYAWLGGGVVAGLADRADPN